MIYYLCQNDKVKQWPFYEKTLPVTNYVNINASFSMFMEIDGLTFQTVHKQDKEINKHNFFVRSYKKNKCS